MVNAYNRLNFCISTDYRETRLLAPPIGKIIFQLSGFCILSKSGNPVKKSIETPCNPLNSNKIGLTKTQKYFLLIVRCLKKMSKYCQLNIQKF